MTKANKKVTEDDRRSFIEDVLERIGAYTDVDLCSEENADAYDALDGEIEDLMLKYFGFDWNDNKDYIVEAVPHV